MLYDLIFGLEEVMSESLVTGESQAPEAAAASANPDLRWYIVHAYSGMEKAVERNITERITRAGMQSKFGRAFLSRPKRPLR